MCRAGHPVQLDWEVGVEVGNLHLASSNISVPFLFIFDFDFDFSLSVERIELLTLFSS